MTVSLLCGIESVRFLRLCRRAPRTTISPKLVCTFKRSGGERRNGWRNSILAIGFDSSGFTARQFTARPAPLPILDYLDTAVGWDDCIGPVAGYVRADRPDDGAMRHDDNLLAGVPDAEQLERGDRARADTFLTLDIRHDRVRE